MALQKLPVKFAMDRAGLVGADGATHSGSFDVTFMACLPDMVTMAPCDEAELFHMVATAAAYDEGPICFRYPRGNGIGVPLPPNNKGVPLQVGCQLLLAFVPSLVITLVLALVLTLVLCVQYKRKAPYSTSFSACRLLHGGAIWCAPASPVHIGKRRVLEQGQVVVLVGYCHTVLL